MRRVLTGTARGAALLALICGAATADAATTGRPIVAVFNIESQGVGSDLTRPDAIISSSNVASHVLSPRTRSPRAS